MYQNTSENKSSIHTTQPSSLTWMMRLFTASQHRHNDGHHYFLLLIILNQLLLLQYNINN